VGAGLDGSPSRACRRRCSTSSDAWSSTSTRETYQGAIERFLIRAPRVVVEEVSNSDVRELRRTILSASHVTVIAVGAFKLEHLVTMLENATKNLPHDHDVRPTTCDAPPIPERRAAIHFADDPHATQSQIAIGAIGVHAGHRDTAALDVLAAAMGASLSSRLSLVIRENHGMSYGVRMHAAHWRTRGTIEGLTSVESARTRDAVKGILAELARAATDALDQRELARAEALLIRTTDRISRRLTRSSRPPRMEWARTPPRAPARHRGRHRR